MGVRIQQYSAGGCCSIAPFLFVWITKGKGLTFQSCSLNLDESVGHARVKRKVNILCSFSICKPRQLLFCVTSQAAVTRTRNCFFGYNIITVICPGKQRYNKAFHIQIFRIEKLNLWLRRCDLSWSEISANISLLRILQKEKCFLLLRDIFAFSTGE